MARHLWSDASLARHILATTSLVYYPTHDLIQQLNQLIHTLLHAGHHDGTHGQMQALLQSRGLASMQMCARQHG